MEPWLVACRVSWGLCGGESAVHRGGEIQPSTPCAPSMSAMFLRGRLQWSLFAITLVSGALAFFFAQRNDSGVEATPTTIATTTTSSTTTVYQPPITYVVQRGDTLFGIAQSFQVNMQALMDLNGISNPDRVEAGDELVMPPATGFVPVAPSTTMLP